MEEQGEPSAREATFRVIWKHHPELGRPKGVVGMGAPFNHPWVLAARLTTDALLDDLLASAPQEYVPDEVIRHLADRPLSWWVERLQRLLAFVPNRHEFVLSVFDSALNTPPYQDSPLPVIQWALGVAPDLPSPTLDVFIEKAVLKGRADAFDALLAARPPRREMPWDRTPLVHTAVEWMLGHPPANRAAAPTPDLLARALAWGDPVEAPGKNGRTALHAIVSAAPLVLSLSRAGHRAHLRRLANRLVEQGASWNTPDAAGNTPLSLAHAHAPFLATEWEKKNARALTRSLKAEMPSVHRLSIGRRRL